MFTFIDNQTAWYTGQAKKLKAVSIQMQNATPEGKRKNLMKKLRALQFASDIVKAVHAFAGNTLAAQKAKAAFDDLAILMKNVIEKELKQVPEIEWQSGGYTHKYNRHNVQSISETDLLKSQQRIQRLKDLHNAKNN